MKKKHVVVIGAGFSGLSTAAYLARGGYRVTVLEKNDQPGGRAFSLKQDGFRFELGPSWYMMPDVFEEFFTEFNEKPPQLTRLDPSYRVFFAGDEQYDLSTKARNAELFSQLEPGAGVELEKYLQKSEQLYRSARTHFLGSPYDNLFRLLTPQKLAAVSTYPLLGSYHFKVKKYFQDPRLQQIMEFMTVFLGGSAKNIPALYTLLGHVDMNLGIWYPKGGFEALAKRLEELAKKKGAHIRYRSAVTHIEVRSQKVVAVKAGGRRLACDAVVGAADYHHIETKLLLPRYRSYQESYWQRRILSPSAVLISIGLDTKVPGLEHHNLFFDVSWDQHFKSIQKGSKIDEPLFYACMPSKTDATSAPEGCENIFVLIPLSGKVDLSKEELRTLRSQVIARLSERAHVDIEKHIVSEDMRSTRYFKDFFNAYQSNAFGLAHTLRQSAALRPRMQSRKVRNLFYAGQYTNPGTGVPLCVLSGKVVSESLIVELEKET